jgi:Electron transfer DM13
VRGRRIIWVALGSVVAVGVAFALYWFQPWKLWTNHRVNDALPAVATQPVAVPHPTDQPVRSGRSPAQQAAGPELLARGSFVSHEHSTSGTASIVRQPDGSRVLAIADLHTSEGPVVKVWLTDQRVTDDGWHVFDDGIHVDLGSLKGNLGNQLYPIPDDVNLARLQSVTIWCDRFDVSFGAAQLAPTR